MDLGLQGRVAVVGASSKGLGRASAAVMAAEGASVVVNGRSPENVEATVDAIRAAGGDALGVPGDMNDPTTADLLVSRAIDTYGRLDVVVGNNAGPGPVRVLEASDDGIMAALEANTISSVRLARAALPHLRENGWGRICMITSSAVRQPAGALATSAIARSALWSWSKMAAVALAEEGITVNLICPGGHATERLAQVAGAGGAPTGGTAPAPRRGDPEHFGKAVAFLCSEPAAFVSGIAFGIDGGAVSGML